MSRTIPISKTTLVATVDDEDYPLLSKYKWHKNGRAPNHIYALTLIEGRPVLMHRLIMSTPKGMDTDHINHQTLDNRKQNLRVCTRAENAANRARTLGGISIDRERSKWIATIQRSLKRYKIGRFDTQEEAQAALDEFRFKMDGVI